MKLAKNGQFASAATALKTALSHAPNHLQSRAALASIYSQRHDTSAALAEYRSILRLAPNNLVAMNNVAWILATSPDDSIRDPEQALILAKRVADGTRHQAVSALDTLAAAYAASGSYAEAVEVVNEAIKLARGTGQTAELPKLQRALELYRKGQPFRDQRLAK